MSAKPLVSVLTPTIPERAHLLKEAVASVKSQTYRNKEHIVEVDTLYQGFSTTTNRASAKASGEYLFVLCDDNIMLPRCLELLMQVVEESGDGNLVVHSLPLVWGEGDGNFRGTAPNIDTASLIPTSAFREVGGFNESLQRTEDRDLYERMIYRNVRFKSYSDAPTWVYRMHHLPDGTIANKSRRAV